MGAFGESARLYVNVDGDASGAIKAMKQADRQLQVTQKSMQGTAKVSQSAFESIKQGYLGAFSQSVWTQGIRMVQGLGGAVLDMLHSAGQMEQFKVQFEVLLGSMDKAEARIAELSAFAAKTPFNLPGVVEASRILEVFTGGMISTGEGLTMVGDIAAGTGRAFEDVAFKIGRLYDAMSSGRSVGEPLMFLSEMGALSGEARERIEELAASVASGGKTMEEAWKEAGGEFTKFAGMMDKQSKTFEGMWSTLQDSINMSIAGIGEEFLGLATEMVGELSTAIADTGALVKQWVKDNKEGIRSFVETSVELFKTFGTRAVDVFTTVSGVVGTAAAAFRDLGLAMGKTREEADKLLPDVVGLATQLGVVWAIASKLGGLTLALPVTAWQVGQAVAPALPGAGEFKQKWEDRFGAGAQGKKPFVTGGAGGGFEGRVPTTAQRGPSTEQFANVTKDYADALRRGKGAVKEAAVSMTDAVYESIIAAREKAAAEARKTPGELAAAIREKRALWQDALTTLGNDMSNSMTKSAEIAKLKAALVGPELAKGLKSADPVVMAQAKETTKIVLDRLLELQGKTEDYGQETGNQYADGILAARGKAEEASKKLATAGGRYLRVQSPPEGPLHNIEAWGTKTALYWVQGFSKAMLTAPGVIAGAMDNVGKALQKSIDKITASFEGFKSYLSAFPPRTASAITAAAKTSAQALAAIWGTLGPGEKVQGVVDLGASITAAKEAAGESPEVQALLAQIDKLQTAIATNMRYATNVGPTRNLPYLQRAGEYRARITDIEKQIEAVKQREADALVEAARVQEEAARAMEDAAAAASVAAYPEVTYSPESSYTGGTGGTQTYYNIDMDVDFNGPTIDPYGDFAQRLAAALIPGLQRELERQGINLGASA